MALVVLAAACAPAAAPAPTAAAQPTAAAAQPTAAVKAAEPTKPAATAPAFDMKAALDKYFSALPDGWSTVASTALKDQMAAAKPFIVDVREAKEITDNGFIEGSVNIPIRTFAKNLDKLPAKDQPIIVAECGSGHRSALAMMGLNMLGYTNVKSLAGGFGAWKAANLPIAK